MKRWLTYILLGLMLWVWYSALFGEKGLLQLLLLRRQREVMLDELQRVREKNAELQREIKMLREDPFYLEMTARKELGVIRRNEILFVLPPKGPSEGDEIRGGDIPATQ